MISHEGPKGEEARVVGHGEVPAFVRELATEAMRYWEPRRLLFNAVLAVLVVGCFFARWPASWELLSWDTVQTLFVLGVLANVCYCAAYVVDLFVQVSGFRATFVRWRWLLLGVGMVFAGVITHAFAIELFSTHGG